MTSDSQSPGQSHGPTEGFDLESSDGSRRSFVDGSVVAGRYRIDAYLDEGGMGQVYRAHDLDLDVPLALKTIQPAVAANPASLRRFKQEILLARSVSHPNVCRIFDLWRDEASGVSFLTMELLAGQSLASRIREGGAMVLGDCLLLVRQMANALDAAHRAGVVHRDFKSANVMLVPTQSGERAVITDFGLAVTVGRGATVRSDRSAGSDTTIEEATDEMSPQESDATIALSQGRGAIVGTPAYMSPEQVAGGVVGPASDLYALGVVLFEMTTGRLPFSGSTPIEVARAHVTHTPPNPAELGVIEPHWEEAILRLLSKDPALRYASAADVVGALEGHIESTPMVRHSLPSERDSFVGRSADIDAIAARLETEDGTGCRVLTLQGTGGTGKTRLSLRYGWESLSRWPGGVWFCDLSEVRSADGIAAAVASALEARLSERNPIDHVGNIMAGRGKSLFILDNFEQVVEHAGVTLAKWLKASGNTRFLVTSRERLRLSEEDVYALEPLEPGTHGVDLFAARAASHRPGFEIDDTNRELVADIVRRLDGLPLAIELAASRLRMLSLEQLRTRLEDRFRILAGGNPGRHQTLRATLDWSWELLRPWEQAAVAQASIFEGGFTLEAAEDVIDLSMYDEDPFVLDVIQSLVDKSWLHTKSALGAFRFNTYASVQEYARERAKENATRDDAQSSGLVESRHGDFYARIGTESLASVQGPMRSTVRTALLAERDNLVTACRRAVARRDANTAEATFRAAESVVSVKGPFGLTVELGRQVIEFLDRAKSGRALVCIGNAERRSGNVQSAREFYETAFAVARETGDRHLEGTLISHIAVLDASEGRVKEAEEGMLGSLAIARELGDRVVEGNDLGNLGVLYATQGRLDDAQSHYEAALAVHQASGHREGEAMILSSLSNLLVDQNRFQEAGKRCTDTTEIARELGNHVLEGYALSTLALIDRLQGRIDVALTHSMAALEIARRSGDRRFEGYLLGDLGALYHVDGRIDLALESLREALSITREVRNRAGEAVVHSNLARLLADQGQLDEAREHVEVALSVHRDLGDGTAEGIALSTLGLIERHQGRMDAAEICFRDSESILRESDDRIELGLVLCAKGEFLVETSKLGSAQDALVEAESIVDDLALMPQSQLVRRVAALREAITAAGGPAEAV